MRRRVAALAAAALLAAGALGGCGGGDGGEPEGDPDAAARLVPADALAYVRADLGDERLSATAAKLPALRRFVDGLAELAGPDVEAWRGEEAALALLDSGGTAADTLLLVAVADRERAQAAVRTTGGVQAALAGDYLAIGQPRVVARAVALARGDGQGLDRAREGDVDAWIAERGVRAVLEPQPGLLGALGTALDDPRLRFLSAAISAEEGGLRLEAWIARRGEAPPAGFEPRLVDHVPAAATAYLGLAGAGGLVERLGLTGLELGEVAVWATGSEAQRPVLVAVAAVRDETAARDAVGRALGRLAGALAPSGVPDAGLIDQLEQRELDGLTATVLPVSGDVEIAAAVADGLLVAATDPAALAAARREAADRLARSERFERVVEEVPGEAEALAYADLAQLLALGEQAGLAEGLAADAAGDLRSVRAFGATAERDGSDTTAEMFLEIP